MSAADLKADRQTGSRESAGNRDAWHAVHVEHDVVVASARAATRRRQQSWRSFHRGCDQQIDFREDLSDFAPQQVKIPSCLRVFSRVGIGCSLKLSSGAGLILF